VEPLRNRELRVTSLVCNLPTSRMVGIPDI
jgi:hypothetical protein